MELLVATRSVHKMAEIRKILEGAGGVRAIDLDEAGIPFHADEEHLEPFETFEENAHSKAAYFSRLSGRPVVADDSGLMVDALGGSPGVHSKRFSSVEGLTGDALDRANNEYLLKLLEGVAPERRTARYVCVAVLFRPGRSTIIVRGETEGVILDEPRGTGGFGYDPLFYVPELGHTFAEVSQEEKNALSHRGRAFRALADALAAEASRR